MAAAAGATKSQGPIYDKEGVLTKLGQKIKSWKSRVFALSKIKKTIYYFASEEQFRQHKTEKVRNFIGTINLQNASLYIADYMDAEICFELSTPARNYFILCKTKGELQDWVSEIASCGVRIKCPFRNTAPEYPSLFAKHGFMDKRGAWVTTFKTRFFRTVENAGGKMVLAYYATVEDMEPKGVIPLHGALIVDVPGTEEFKIQIPGQDRVFTLRAKPKEETDKPDKNAKDPNTSPAAAAAKLAESGEKNKSDKKVWMEVLAAISRGDYEFHPPEQVAAAAAATAAGSGAAAAAGSGAASNGHPSPALNPAVAGSAMAHRELYDVLGVAPTATPEEIVKAYKSAAKKLHPDSLQNRNDPQAKEKFQNLLAAYHALMDKETRAKYDADGDSSNIPGSPSASSAVGISAAAAVAPDSKGPQPDAAAGAAAGGAAPTAADREREEKERREKADRDRGRPETAEEKAAREKQEKIDEARRAKLAMYGTSKNPKQTLVDIIYSQKEDEKTKEFRTAEQQRADADRAAREQAYKLDTAAAATNTAPAGGVVPPGSPVASTNGVTPSASPFPSPAPTSVIGGTAAASSDSKVGATSSPTPAVGAAAAASPAGANPNAAADAMARDRATLNGGVEMIKIPRWGDHTKRKYYFVEVKRAGEKGKPDTTEWAIKWESKGKKAAETTFFITGCQLFKGHQKGYFKDKDNQKKYPAAQCFTLFSTQREMDLACCRPEDFPVWMNVLTPLVSKVIEPPTGK